MPLPDLLELGDLFLSWRLYAGVAITAAVCWIIMANIPNETIGWAICVPVGALGLFLSFRWQIDAD